MLFAGHAERKAGTSIRHGVRPRHHEGTTDPEANPGFSDRQGDERAHDRWNFVLSPDTASSRLLTPVGSRSHAARDGPLRGSNGNAVRITDPKPRLPPATVSGEPGFPGGFVPRYTLSARSGFDGWRQSARSGRHHRSPERYWPPPRTPPSPLC